jgi:hypothetical protein
LFIGTADMAAASSSLGMGQVARRLGFLGPQQLQPRDGFDPNRPRARQNHCDAAIVSPLHARTDILVAVIV